MLLHVFFLKQDEIAGYTCTCYDGYAGVNCDININDCSPDPCDNGVCMVSSCIVKRVLYSTCVSNYVIFQDGIAAYTCNCDPGWTGMDCDEDIDECEPAPCLNGGTCIVCQY